ncbi:MAG: cyclic pyranopterin monophosphate synthase MoaC [Candidatus Latescibacterota bacterium]
MKKLSHVDDAGRPMMVDVTYKKDVFRVARASGRIELAAETCDLIRSNAIAKGNVLTVAEVAGIQAAKRTGELIPLCHSLNITSVKVRAQLEERAASVESEVTCVGKTGVEMEALTAVSVALLTIYDMCKAVDKTMRLTDIVLIEKRKEPLPE